mmetsp:Transcript_7488/g.33830  ORF Transcript_7488/g.33830 Transcript_7488/m.33830 type:complete len:477 (-) Transcript_7488:1451-2881(-)
MSALREVLPQPCSQHVAREQTSSPSKSSAEKGVPLYRSRQGFSPRASKHFGDGGAFPEVHVAQYPPAFGLGNLNPDVLKGTSTSVGSIVPVSSSGDSRYDAAYASAVPRHAGPLQITLQVTDRPSENETKAVVEKTKEVLLKRIDKHATNSQSKVAGVLPVPEYVKYMPSRLEEDIRPGGTCRLIKMHEVARDPLEPPRFRHKKVPRGPGAPPVPVMHSPPRSASSEEQADWKIPPSISNWKNPKGYTIPLDKRLAADGRGLQEVQINDNFAKFSEALYLAEHKARQAVETRAKIREKVLHRDKEAKEDELRKLALHARMERVNTISVHEHSSAGFDEQHLGNEREYLRRSDSPADKIDHDTEKQLRDSLREDRKRERERDNRLEVGEHNFRKRSKPFGIGDRDVSEQVALGQSKISVGHAQQTYDQRLFDKDQGMGSGFVGDDAYNLYDRPLFQKGNDENLVGIDKNEVVIEYQL